jgi:hypothetical protein
MFGGCTTYGPLGFSRSSTNKCALHDTFHLQSNNQSSQLGARLDFNFVGGFYACGIDKEVCVIFCQMRVTCTDNVFRFGTKYTRMMVLHRVLLSTCTQYPYQFK